MILVRIVFQAKLGQGGQMAANMKEGVQAMRSSGAPGIAPRHVRILTDLSGPFDTVVQEMEYDSVDDFLKSMEAMFANPDWQDMSRISYENILGGSKEYYTVEYEE